MKSEYWDGMRRGDWVIYANEYDGVHRAKIIEVDIRLYDPGLPSKWGYPYGLTAETGTVKIRYDTTEKIENLENLLAYIPGNISKLKKAWNQMQAAKAKATSITEAFLMKVRELNV